MTVYTKKTLIWRYDPAEMRGKNMTNLFKVSILAIMALGASSKAFSATCVLQTFAQDTFGQTYVSGESTLKVDSTGELTATLNTVTAEADFTNLPDKTTRITFLSLTDSVTGVAVWYNPMLRRYENDPNGQLILDLGKRSYYILDCITYK